MTYPGILNQHWTIEEISIFSNSSHLEWRAELSDTILKRTHPGTIPARLGLIWFSGFRGEDLNVKVYDVRRTDNDGWRMPSDGKSSHCLWPGELKTYSVHISESKMIHNARKKQIKSVTQSTVLSNCTPGFKINYTNQVKMTQNKYVLLLKENHT